MSFLHNFIAFYYLLTTTPRKTTTEATQSAIQQEPTSRHWMKLMGYRGELLSLHNSQQLPYLPPSD